MAIHIVWTSFDNLLYVISTSVNGKELGNKYGYSIQSLLYSFGYLR